MNQFLLKKAKFGAFLLCLALLWAIPFAQAQTRIYEAEEARLEGPGIFKGRNARGGSYVDFINPSDDLIEWTVDVAQSGPYLLHFVYQMGGLETSRDTYLFVNGEVARDSLMVFPNSGSWQSWKGIDRQKVHLKAGSNTITLVAQGVSGPNLDYLSVSPQVLEAEKAALDGVSVLSGRGSSNSQYVDFQHPEGDRLIWEVNVPAKGLYTLRFHYQLGYGLDRPLQMKVNERIVNYNGSFPYTGSWNTWSSIDYAVFLKEGTNTLELNAIGASGANFDFLEVSPAPFEEVSASIRHKINFSDQATPAPEGWIQDFGAPFGTQASGLHFGWLDLNTNEPVSLLDYGRNRLPNPDRDVLRETLQHFDHPSPTAPDAKWEIELPNGSYRVIVQSGDPGLETQVNTRHLIRVEGQTVLDFPMDLQDFGVRNGTALVSLNDGRLTLDAVGGSNSKIQFIVIESTDGFTSPAVLLSNPPDGAQLVSPSTTISANFLHIPNISESGASSLDNTTITENTVQLFEIAGDQDILIPSTVNGTGGGDAINLTPLSDLKANTSYRFVIRDVRDLAGETLIPFSEVFVTGDAIVPPGSFLDEVAFEKFSTTTKAARFTTLTIGPDGKMYAMEIFGDIYRWDIAPEGQLVNEEIINTWKNNYSTDRLGIGLVFDPQSTADNLIAYISHATQTPLSGPNPTGPPWDGRLSRLSGPNLENERLLVTNLPRSVRDHLTNSIVFRPGEDQALYFLQGSNSGGGGLEDGWGNRAERLLSGALLRLDLNRLPDDQPLDVRTSEDLKVINNARTDEPLLSDGTYNPYYVYAPLTIAASGVRNAYDLVWHSNGQAYIPTNGTGGGSQSPASIPGTRRPDGSFYNGQQVPAIGPNENQRDWLFRIDPNEPVGYYGHPNVTRGEYVLNRGPLDEADYPPFIQADANFRGAAFDFQYNVSPNGVIEYQNTSNFNGLLQGAMIVCRYSGGSDLVVLVPDGPQGDINTFRIGIPGFTQFRDPLDLIEDPSTGFIYVSDYGRSEIILLKPQISGSDPANTRQNTMVSESRVRIYPNPSESGERIRIEMRGPSEEEVHYQLFNLQGRLIWSTELPASQKQKFLELSSELVQPGIYQLQIQGEDWQETRKILVRE